MNNPIPQEIAAFIHHNHVVSIACCVQQELWAASCFYAFDESSQRLIILTDSRTKHGRMLLLAPQVAGTIAGQPLEVSAIEGIQFQAIATRLEHEQQAVVLADYYSKHPIAKGRQSEVWALDLTYIKHTENRTAFGYKREWFR